MLLGIEILFGILLSVCFCKCVSNDCCEKFCNLDQYPGYSYNEQERDSTNKSVENEDIEIILITENNISEIEKKYNSECCSICLCDYVLNEHLSVTGCGHAFHANCLTEWVMKKSICPMCNTNLVTNLNDPPPPYHQDDEIREYSDDEVFL